MSDWFKERPHVLGQDGRIHLAEHHMKESLSACDRVVAIRAITLKEERILNNPRCERCFPDG